MLILLTITTAADLSAIYFAGRKIRITDGGANVVEGTITHLHHMHLLHKL